MADADLHAADSYDYDLPRDLVAQEPLADRAAARLLVVNRADGSLSHRYRLISPHQSRIQENEI